MSEKTFILQPDTRGALYYGIIYGLTAAVSIYMVYTFGEDVTWFYLFLFSFWYSLFAGVTTVFSQCLLLLPFSIREVVVAPQRVTLRKCNGKEKILTSGFNYSASGKSMVIAGLTDERRKISEVIRIRSLEEKEYDRLVQMLKRLAEKGK